MADDKQGRDEQARNVERRQRERDLRTELERRNEVEPPVEDADLDELETALGEVSFPATGADVVAAVGDRTVTAGTDRYAVEELLPKADVERFESPEVVRVRIKRPTIASAMKRIVEAADSLPDAEFSESKRDAYEKTLRAMQSLDTSDEDSGVRALADWVVEEIEASNRLPDSRDLRRRGAKLARKYGHEVRNDEWLGV